MNLNTTPGSFVTQTYYILALLALLRKQRGNLNGVALVDVGTGKIYIRGLQTGRMRLERDGGL